MNTNRNFFEFTLLSFNIVLYVSNDKHHIGSFTQSVIELSRVAHEFKSMNRPPARIQCFIKAKCCYVRFHIVNDTQPQDLGFWIFSFYLLRYIECFPEEICWGWGPAVSLFETLVPFKRKLYTPLAQYIATASELLWRIYFLSRTRYHKLRLVSVNGMQCIFYFGSV